MNSSLNVLIIIFISGLIHVSWNARYKSTRNPEQLFIGSRIFNSIYLLPLFLIFYKPINIEDLIYLLGTTITHFFYFYFLIAMYKNEEFSKVYPLSRGLGNLLTPIFGISLINELVSKLSIVGILINLSLFIDTFIYFKLENFIWLDLPETLFKKFKKIYSVLPFSSRKTRFCGTGVLP